MDAEVPGTYFSLAEVLETSAKKKRSVGIALSVPSFEVWYLLHFEDFDRPFCNAEDVERALRRHLPRYRKNDPGVFDLVDAHRAEAIRRAKRADKRHQAKRTPRPDRSPNTEVYQLVQVLAELAARGPAWSV
jgi:hypothetical protein